MKKYFRSNNTTSKYWPLLCIGLLINSGVRLVDRFVVKIPEGISIIFALIAVILMITGMILMLREKRNKEDKYDAS